MKLPGEALPEFEVDPTREGGTRLRHAEGIGSAALRLPTPPPENETHSG